VSKKPKKISNGGEFFGGGGVVQMDVELLESGCFRAFC